MHFFPHLSVIPTQIPSQKKNAHLSPEKPSKNIAYIVGGFNPFEKYYIVKLDHLPPNRGEKKY